MDRIMDMLDASRSAHRRDIEGLFGEGGAFARLGTGGVTRIEVYGEPGDGAYVPWFAIYRGDSPTPDERVNARYVSRVVYTP